MVTLTHDLSNENARDLSVFSTDHIDGFMDEGFNTVNYGTHSFMDVGLQSKGGTELRIIALYDLNNAIPPDATITAAEWWLHINTNSCAEIVAYQWTVQRCTRIDWHEGYVTWDNYKEFTAWTNPGGDIDITVRDFYGLGWGSSGWWHRSIVNNVADAHANRGGILSMIFGRYFGPDDAGFVRFSAKENQDPPGPGVSVYAPHVRITYTLDGKTFQRSVC